MAASLLLINVETTILLLIFNSLFVSLVFQLNGTFIVLGTPALIIVVFLPSLLELKRPQDRGPRIIMEDFHVGLGGPLGIATIVNIEEEHRFDRSLLPRLLNAIEVLPCLEV